MIERTHSIGERPQNPLIFDKAVIYIDDIIDEGIEEETQQHKWSYIQTEIVPIDEYFRRSQAQILTEAYENTIELIEELRPEA